MLLHPPEKARWGRDGGLGGKDYGNAFPAERLGPLALAEGVPLPLNLNPQSISEVKTRGGGTAPPGPK